MVSIHHSNLNHGALRYIPDLNGHPQQRFLCLKNKLSQLKTLLNFPGDQKIQLYRLSLEGITTEVLNLSGNEILDFCAVICVINYWTNDKSKLLFKDVKYNNKSKDKFQFRSSPFPSLYFFVILRQLQTALPCSYQSFPSSSSPPPPLHLCLRYLLLTRSLRAGRGDSHFL